MTGTVFNVFLGGTGEKLNNNDYEFSMGVTSFLKGGDGSEFVDYVFYDGVDVDGDHHRYPITPSPNVLGDTGALLLGEGSDNILESVCALVAGQVEPERLLGMVTHEKRHPPKEYPINLRSSTAEEITLLKKALAESQKLDQAQQKKVNGLIDGIRQKKISQVNLIGWSRGGFNAIRIANKLHDQCPSVVVNLLTLDPVPGPTNHTPQTLKLSKNVKYYVSLIALNEYRLGFIPVIPAIEKGSGTQVHVVTVPGNHSSMMGDKRRSISSSDHIGPLVDRTLRFAIKTLQSWNALKIDLKSDTQELADWKLIANHRDQYEHAVSDSSVSSEVQVINYKTVESPFGKQRYRLLHEGEKGYQYLDTLPSLQHNPPNDLDIDFKIASDTCTLHRDYNDRQIAASIEEQVRICQEESPNDDELSNALYKLFVYLHARHETRGKDTLLAPAIEQLKACDPGKSIFLSACLGDVDFISVHDRSLNSQNHDGDTPLMIAVRYGEEKFVQKLLENKVNCSLRNTAGETALMVAARYGQIGSIRRLRSHYSTLEQVNALIQAAKYNQGRSVKALLDCVDCTASCLLNHSAIEFLLIWSIDNNDLQLLRSLIENSRILLTRQLNKEGKTPLTYAQDLQREAIVTELLSQPSGKPFLTAPRMGVGLATVCALGYSSTVLATSLHAAHYPSLVSTLFVATQIYAPVAIVAVILAALAVIASLAMGYQGIQHLQHHKTVGYRA